MMGDTGWSRRKGWVLADTVEGLDVYMLGSSLRIALSVCCLVQSGLPRSVTST